MLAEKNFDRLMTINFCLWLLKKSYVKASQVTSRASNESSIIGVEKVYLIFFDFPSKYLK